VVRGPGPRRPGVSRAVAATAEQASRPSEPASGAGSAGAGYRAPVSSLAARWQQTGGSVVCPVRCPVRELLSRPRRRARELSLLSNALEPSPRDRWRRTRARGQRDGAGSCRRCRPRSRSARVWHRCPPTLTDFTGRVPRWAGRRHLPCTWPRCRRPAVSEWLLGSGRVLNACCSPLDC
jgi:hypothetical protein